MLEAEGLVKVALKVFSRFDQLSHVGLLQGFQVGLAGLDKLFLMFVPVPLKVPYVLLFLLEQLVHLDVVLSENRTASLVILLVPQLLDLRLRLFRVYIAIRNEAPRSETVKGRKNVVHFTVLNLPRSFPSITHCSR